MNHASPPQSLEAKLVVLGSQGVGKTSLVHRFVKNAFIPPNKAQSTVGASFVTTRTHVDDTTIRLQIWDTAGQERFRSISRLYYRGAQAAILCYDVTNNKSFEDISFWLKEIREYAGSDIIVQIVGTKSDVALANPEKREVTFERCTGYAADHLIPDSLTPGPKCVGSWGISKEAGDTGPLSTTFNNRCSGFWGQEPVWEGAHEVSAKDGEGVEELFRVITRKLVEQHARKLEHLSMLENTQTKGRTPGIDGAEGYFDLPKGGNASFRVGYGDRRRSWLGLPLTPGALNTPGTRDDVNAEIAIGMRKGRCC